MENEIDLRCHTLHFYFKIDDSEIFGGEGADGYVAYEIEKATKVPTIDEEKELADSVRTGLSEMLKVPIDKIIRISRDEYLENTEEEEHYCYEDDTNYEVVTSEDTVLCFEQD